MKNVKAIGIEAEIGAKEFIEIPRFKLTRDESVRSRKGYAVEYVSIPFESENELYEAFRGIKGNIAEINSSMGLHIHVSLRRDEDYRYLMTEKFFSYFIEKVREYGERKKDRRLLNRLENNFCKGYGLTGQGIERQFRAEGKYGERYYAVNYAYSLHGTIEFRIFPAVRYLTKLRDYVRLVVETIDEFLECGEIVKRIKEIVTIEEEEGDTTVEV